MSLSQSEQESQPLSDPQGAEDSLLVAYLDGELDEKEKSAFEKQLAEQPQLQQKLAEYEKAWKALDYLEPSTPDQAKVYSTLELIALRAEKEAKSLAVVEKKTKYRNGILTLIGLFLVTGLGYLTVNQFFGADDNREIYDLLLIERLDQYKLLEGQNSSQIDEIEFLRKLHDSNILD